MAEKKLNLLADFPEVTTEEWMAKIEADLKGADFTKRLVWRTNEGFNVVPFYRAEDLADIATTESAPGVFPFVRGTKKDNSWYVRQNIDAKDVKAANAKALDILNKGVDSIGFKLGKSVLDKESIATLLKGIYAECVELNFKICLNHSAEFVTLLADYFKAQGYDLAKVKGSINCDPINHMLKKGKKLNKASVAAILKEMADVQQQLPKFRLIGVNSISLNNSGAYCSQELGYALAWGEQYMEMLTEANVPAEKAAKTIKFNMGVGGNYFMEIAKFRSARLLWAKIVDAFQPNYPKKCEATNDAACYCAAKMHIHAETSKFNKTIYDAHVNLLRTETEAMSAVLGGVDSLTVMPFDITYKASDDFSERIARNQQLLLRDESHFGKVTDPAAGSYYIENLTANIAEQAWKLFLEINANGGFFAAVESGKIQEEMKATAAKRLKDVSSRKEILLGTNQFPNFDEQAAEKIVKEACSHKRGCSEEPTLEMLPHVRAAQEFEELRLETERSGKRPKAFMLTIGNLAMRLARAQFSCNFLACAGYEIIDNLGFETVEEGVKAAQEANADIIVLCSSDDEYAEYAPAAFKAINGKQIFVVAGAPACMEELKAQGIEHFIHVKANVLDTLKLFNAKLLK
ncbi:MAG: methylmalonyl-CoA mutase small subunit [Paludibacteraceae bacterium]|jgi:methylmalonyl-CoA mutase|nr:methylmalonyl-CoA mutase small subunit [Paludibacteraceae bacterium]MDI9537369.1 methylmalonyl-CoA mutase small subunit [Bacteroidota bacterium]MBP9038825.1 methylmalonyl-CoA mutase small subunit [Paludibacteraceae bacterium]HOA46021.1 methylmalonyl-CoA mutase small subunit [Paludibacteraceae bacterium]HOH70516.1 methylmalonyl-CoA mutase small subunit [Paludibacteraceae bacterium]